MSQMSVKEKIRRAYRIGVNQTIDQHGQELDQELQALRELSDRHEQERNAASRYHRIDHQRVADGRAIIESMQKQIIKLQEEIEELKGV